MKTRKTFKILSIILITTLALLLLKQEVTKRIVKKVVENSFDSNNPVTISRDIKRLDVAIFLNPKIYNNYRIKGELNLRLKNYREALIDFEKSHSAQDDSEDIYRLQGMIYDWLGDSYSAKIYYKKAINIIESKIKNNQGNESRQEYKMKLVYASFFLHYDFIKPNENYNSELDSSLSKQSFEKAKFEILNDRFSY